MHILLLVQYFDPEPTFKGLLFARELVRQGHTVEVLTGFPNYPGGKIYPGYRMRLLHREEIDGIRIVRVPLFPSHDSSGFRRILTYLTFGCAAALIGPWVVRRPDVIHAYHGHATIGLPAVTIGLLRRAPFVLDIQDLWPDSITASGMLPRGLRFLVPVVAAWCRFLYWKAARISVLSRGFQKELATRGVPESKVEVIPNWCDEVQVGAGPLASEEDALFTGQLAIVMAGNMGRMQGLDVVLDAAAMLGGLGPKVRFLLVGGGVDRPRLEERSHALGLTNVAFLPARPIREIGAILNRADALFVHLKDDPLFAITIPSKIQAYLAVGRPILCGVRGNGSDLVREAGAGICFNPDNATELVVAVRSLLEMTPQERQDMGDRGRSYYLDRLSVSVGTEAFISLFKKAVTR